MDADEFRSALDRLGLTQVEAAALMRVDKQTVNRWATGYRAVPPPAAVLLLLVEKVGLKKATKLLK